MPIPFILAGAAAVAGAVGVKKGIDAVKTNQEAKQISDDARYLVAIGEYTIEENRIALKEALDSLGEGKLKLLTQLQRYVRQMNRIRNMELEEVRATYAEQVDNQTFQRLETYTHKLTDLLAGVSLSAGSGLLTAFGAYSGAMTFGAASTGTAISGLTGVAATNATLAYLGGGSLAAGGYGVAGGTFILGSLIAGPALAVGGFALNALADKKLEGSKAEAAKAKTLHAQQQVLATALETTYTVTDAFNTLLLEVRKLQLKADRALGSIVKEKTDWNTYSTEEKQTVQTTLLIAQLVKGLLETSVLDESGGLLPETTTYLQELAIQTENYRNHFN